MKVSQSKFIGVCVNSEGNAVNVILNGISMEKFKTY